VITLTAEEIQGYQLPATFTFFGRFTRVAVDENWPTIASPWFAATADKTHVDAQPVPTCSNDAAGADAQQFGLFGEASWGCADAFFPLANSKEEAQQCLKDKGLTEAEQLCDYQVLLETGPNHYVYVRSSNEEGAVKCARVAGGCDNCSPRVTSTIECTE
jgi:hypothetical protein